LVTADLATSLISIFWVVLWPDVQQATERGEEKFLVVDSLNVAAQIMHCWLTKYNVKEKREVEGCFLKYQRCYKI